MIGIRVDANNIVATGHVMRCMAIAQAIQKRGETVLFFTVEKACVEIVRKNGYETILLEGHWDELGGEIIQLQKGLRQNKCELLLVDSYYITNDYFQKLRQVIPVAYIDDYGKEQYSIDILISYGSQLSQLEFEKIYHNTRLLIGKEYAPLREEFSGCNPKIISRTVQNVLIMIGGSDNFGFLEFIVNVVAKNEEYCDYHFTIISGKFNHSLQLLKKAAQKLRNIEILSDVSNMRDIMDQSDIAISAGGSTLYELCACGVPTISYSFIDNQLPNVRGFQTADLVFYMGDLRDGMESCVLRCLNKMTELSCDFDKRQELSLKMQSLIDGNGAERIAEKLLSNSCGNML